MFKAGSGSALKKTAGSEFALRRTAGSGSAKNEFGSTGLERNVGEKEEGHLFHSCHTSYSEPECDVTVINIRGSEQLVPGQLQAALGQVALTKVLQYSSTQVSYLNLCSTKNGHNKKTKIKVVHFILKELFLKL